MTKVDQPVESAADRIDAIVREARAAGGARTKVADAVAEKARLRRSPPTLERAPEPPKPRRAGPSPWLVIGVAFAAGYVLAKVIDWRGHAHPRL
jgi:hypothetical protein